MDRQESRTVSTQTKVILDKDDIREALRAYTGLYEGKVVLRINSNGLLTQVEVTETHIEVVSTP